MTAMVNAPFLSLSPAFVVRSNNLYLTFVAGDRDDFLKKHIVKQNVIDPIMIGKSRA
jgi:hypothetical protein